MKKVKVGLVIGLIISLLAGNVHAYAAEVGLIGVTDDGHDHTSYFTEINQDLNTMGYADSTITSCTNPSKAIVMNLLDTCEIVVTRSHGARFLDEDGNVTGNCIALQSEYIYDSDIDDLTEESLDNLILAVYLGCYTAAGGISDGTEKNLVVATEINGAATVVGFEGSILCTGANSWVEYFFENLADGDNIDVALNSAVTSTENRHWIYEAAGSLNIDSCRYRGVWDYTFTE